MVRKKHGEAPVRKTRKKAAKKVAAKSGKAAKPATGPRSILERAAAKKRARAASDKMQPTRAPPCQDAARDKKVVVQKRGEHPVDTLARATAKKRAGKRLNPATNIDDERSQFKLGPLGPEVIDDISRMLRAGLHRTIAERLLGLSKGRIATWIARGKQSREAIEAWHDAHDDLVQAGGTKVQFRKLGKQPEFDMYALFHACVLRAEAEGEKTCVAGIVNAAMGKDELPADWKANAWLLSRRYNKRWGAYAERSMTEEEDQVDGGDGKDDTAVDRLAGVLDEMFGKRIEDADELAK